MCELAKLYGSGNGCEHSDIKAMQYLQRAAVEIGNEQAQKEIVGLLNGKPLGSSFQPTNLSRQQKLLFYCSPDNTMSEACHQACIYSSMKKYDKTLETIVKAAETNDPDSLCFLGNFYLNSFKKDKLFDEKSCCCGSSYWTTILWGNFRFSIV
jgi:TPR repeat protein